LLILLSSVLVAGIDARRGAAAMMNQPEHADGPPHPQRPSENAFAPGAMRPEIGCRVIREDAHVNGQCRRCFYQVRIFRFTIGTYAQCPNCLRERIERVVSDGVPLDGELFVVYDSVRADLEEQDDTLWGCLSLEMPEFCRCAQCDRLLQAEDAWYCASPGDDDGEPYCGGSTGD
jgi:hypothetical protein